MTARGFSLLETIAVLVVAGTIIGGIWLTYSSVTQQSRLAQMDNQMAKLVDAAKSYLFQYNELDSRGYNQNPASGILNLTPALVNGDMLPDGVRPAPSSDEFVLLEFGNATVYSLRSASNYYGSGPMVSLAVRALTRKVCMAVLGNWAGSPERIQSSGMISVTNNPAPVHVHTDNRFENLAPGERALSTQLISDNCPGNNNTLIFWFRLNK